MYGLYLQKRLYRTDNSRLIISQPSPLFKGLFAFHMRVDESWGRMGCLYCSTGGTIYSGGGPP
jgi:hypothetical protein